MNLPMVMPRIEEPLSEHERLAQITNSGQAFWATTGPDGKTCRECVFFGQFKKTKYKQNVLTPSRCQKYTRIAGKQGDAIPHDSRACKYFEQHPNPPKPRKG